MSADLMTSLTEQTEPVTNTSAMDTANDIIPGEFDEKPVNGTDEEPTETESKASKRKRSTKKVAESVENISNGRPKRNLSKRK
jgi:hypothetical protein